MSRKFLNGTSAKAVMVAATAIAVAGLHIMGQTLAAVALILLALRLLWPHRIRATDRQRWKDASLVVVCLALGLWLLGAFRFLTIGDGKLAILATGALFLGGVLMLNAFR